MEKTNNKKSEFIKITCNKSHDYDEYNDKFSNSKDDISPLSISPQMISYLNTDNIKSIYNNESQIDDNNIEKTINKKIKEMIELFKINKDNILNNIKLFKKQKLPKVLHCDIYKIACNINYNILLEKFKTIHIKN